MAWEIWNQIIWWINMLIDSHYYPMTIWWLIRDGSWKPFRLFRPFEPLGNFLAFLVSYFSVFLVFSPRKVKLFELFNRKLSFLSFSIENSAFCQLLYHLWWKGPIGSQCQLQELEGRVLRALNQNLYEPQWIFFSKNIW